MEGGPIRKTALLVWAVLASNAAAPSGEQQRIGIERIAWLQGCWEMVSPERTIEEQWMAPRGKSMLGMSRTVRGDSLVGYEVVVLREHGDQLAYQAHLSGQPSAIFLSRTVTDSMVLFENAEHDFPQRIGYRRDRSDALVAWIEGTTQGQARRADFTYRRTMCPGRTRPRP